MDYKKEMRQLIDIVKQQSFDAPLEQTLDDMKTLTTAVKDLNDRIEMRVRKNINPTDKPKKTKSKSKKLSAMPKAGIPKTKPTTSTNNSLPTGNSVSASSVSAKDLDNIKTDFITRQKSVQPIQAQPPVYSFVSNELMIGANVFNTFLHGFTQLKCLFDCLREWHSDAVF